MKYFRDKTRWLVLAMALMALPSVAEVRDTVDFDFLTRTYENITVGNETFIRYSFPDCDHIDQVGAPMLPVKYIHLSVPYNATNITVKPLCSWTPAFENKPEYPAPVPLTTNDTIPDQPELVIDSAIYMTDAYWPPAAAELVGEGFYMGENHIITVAVYPMLYNPVQNKMHNYTQVRVKVSYDPGGTPANMLVRYDNRLRQQELQQTKSLVANPQQVEAHAVPASTVHHMMMQQNPDTTDWPVPGYEYMVITTRELAPAFKRLIALKQQKGYRAGVVCVEDIVNDPLVQYGDVSTSSNGDTISIINDDAGKVRQYLKENFHYGTRFVLFGGKMISGVPIRYGEHRVYQNVLCDTPTDLYFGDLTENWNYDLDSLYGEPNDFGPIKIPEPDIFVGRLLCKNMDEINNYIEKLYRYELNPGNGNSTYLTQALYTQHAQMTTAGCAERNALIVHDFFESNIINATGPNSPTGTFLVNEMNNNYGFINIFNHGDPASFYVNIQTDWGTLRALWAISGVEPCPKSGRIKKESGKNALNMLTNKYAPSVMYSIACTNMPFDVFTNYNDYDYTYDMEYSFGESFTLGKNYGGIAFLGNTRFGWVSSSPLLDDKFVQNIAKGYYKIGVAEALSKMGHLDFHLRLTHNLLGDPEFEIWTDTPYQYQNISLIRGDNSVTITGLDNNSSHAIIGLNDGLTQKMDSTATGSMTFTNVNPNSTVMVYRHNYLPFIAPLYLQNERVERSQYVIANDVYAGSNVDSNRTAGDLTIAEGVEYELDAKGQVVLAPGFKVEKGALFSVTQSDY